MFVGSCCQPGQYPLLLNAGKTFTVRHIKEQREEAAKVSAADKRVRDLEKKLALAQASSFASRLQSSGGLGDRRPVGRSTSRYLYGARTRTSVYYYPRGRSYFPRRPAVNGTNARPRGSSSRGISYGSRGSLRGIRVSRPPVRNNTAPRRCPNGRD